MLKDLDITWTQGSVTNFRYLGPVGGKGGTGKWSVTSRVSGALFGYVRWFGANYCFFSLDQMFPPAALEDILEFLARETAEERKDWKSRKGKPGNARKYKKGDNPRWLQRLENARKAIEVPETKVQDS